MAGKAVLTKTYLRTFCVLAIVIGVVVLFIPYGFFVVLVYFAGLRRLARLICYALAKQWALLIIKASGCKMNINGRENIPKKGPLCFVSNHTGALDIALLLAYAGRPFGFVAKKELAFVPFLNMWILMLGGLFIDRKNPRSALKSISTGIKSIKSGNAMLIFPEGHRSRGEGLLPFRAGAFKLAVRSNAPLIPVAISGCYEVFEKNRLVIPAPVSISFGAPVSCGEEEAGGAKRNLNEKIREIIDNMLKSK